MSVETARQIYLWVTAVCVAGGLLMLIGTLIMTRGPKR
jgi:hypothetical protein